MRDRLKSLAYGAGWRVVRELPYPLAWRFFSFAAKRAAARNGRGVQRLRANLRRVVGASYSEHELENLVREGMRSYARYWMEAFRLPSLSPQTILDTMRVENVDALKAAYERGRGVVCALPHCGNWDHAGAWACVSGYRISTVAERLRPEDLYQRFLDYRRRLGMEIVPAVGSDRAPLDVLTDRLRAGGLVVLLADRDISARGVPVSFFGGHVRIPAGPALLALRTGAPLFTVSLWHESGLNRARVEGPLKLGTRSDGADGSRLGTVNVKVISQVSQMIADRFAASIAEHPTDWHMLQRLWVDEAVSLRQ